MFRKDIDRTPQTVRRCSSIATPCNALLVFLGLHLVERITPKNFLGVFRPLPLTCVIVSAQPCCFLQDSATETDSCLVFAIALDCWYPDNEDWNCLQRTTSKQGHKTLFLSTSMKKGGLWDPKSCPASEDLEISEARKLHVVQGPSPRLCPIVDNIWDVKTLYWTFLCVGLGALGLQLSWVITHAGVGFPITQLSLSYSWSYK